MSVLLEEIIKDKRYKSLCNKLTKSSYIADDLYQDFILNCLERGHDYFENRFDTYAETNKFCMGIISNSYRNKNRLTSSLFNLYYQEYSKKELLNFSDTYSRFEAYDMINEPIDDSISILDKLINEEGKNEKSIFDKLKNENKLDVALLVTSKTVKNFKTFCKEADIDYRNADYRVQKLKHKLRNAI